MYIIIFIIVLAALIFVHELGHFLIAKAFSIRVDEFALGFPPKIFSFKKGETRYSLNMIPFGGFVKIFGEDNEEATTPRSFAGKPKYAQVSVLLAGIAFNIIFAWLLLSLSFMTAPVMGNAGNTINGEVVVISVIKNSPAEKAGILPGDMIASLRVATNKIDKPTSDEIKTFVSKYNNTSVVVEVDRGSNIKTVTVIPEIQTGDNRPTIGITMDSFGIPRLSFFPAIWEGLKLTGNLIVATVKGLAVFLGSIFTGKAHLSDVTGPVGIAGLVGDATRLGWSYLFSFTAFISINLAVINLIPFPALDGGRVLFVLIEKIKGKPLNQKIVQVFNLTGLALLLLLMFVVTYHDIATLITQK